MKEENPDIMAAIDISDVDRVYVLSAGINLTDHTYHNPWLEINRDGDTVLWDNDDYLVQKLLPTLEAFTRQLKVVDVETFNEVLPFIPIADFETVRDILQKALQLNLLPHAK